MTISFIENKYLIISVYFPRHHWYCYLLVHHMRDLLKLNGRRKKNRKRKLSIIC